MSRITFPENQGGAILDITVLDGGGPLMGGTPPPPPAGYTLLPIDLNDGTGGNYIWLCYKMGRADGLEGTPIGEIYTVDEFDGETPVKGGYKIPVNLNEGLWTTPKLLWLYKIPATDKVARCVVVANKTVDVMLYGPPEAEGKYNVAWVQRLIPDQFKQPFPEFPPDTQDLNEGESSLFVLSDWIFIGYCTD